MPSGARLEREEPEQEKWKYLKWIIVFATGFTLAAGTCLHFFGPGLVARHPELRDTVDNVKDIVVLFMLAEIVAYLVEERQSLLRKLPNQQSLLALAEYNRNELVKLLARPVDVQMYSTAEETYRALKATIDRINGTVDGEKQMLHGILHTSLPTRLSPDVAAHTVEEYYAEFDAAITACIRSKGAGRWNVRQVYNVVTPERLEVIEKRIEAGTEGFQVRAVIVPDLVPCFSPLVMGEEDAFLGVIDSPNYRVGAALHLHGNDAARFVVRYFELLWDEGIKLRTEKGIDQTGLRQLKRGVEHLSDLATG